MFNLDDIKNKNDEDHNKKWSYTPEWYRMLIIGGSGSGKKNALLNLTLIKRFSFTRFTCMWKT